MDIVAGVERASGLALAVGSILLVPQTQLRGDPQRVKNGGSHVFRADRVIGGITGLTV